MQRVDRATPRGEEPGGLTTPVAGSDYGFGVYTQSSPTSLPTICRCIAVKTSLLVLE